METASASGNAYTASFPRILYRIASLPGDVLAFLFLIIAMNLHLLGVGSVNAWIFIPEAVADGEWWRLVTHPFVHVSWYHLALDAGAFCLLYHGFEEKSGLRKLLVAVACGGASLLGALLFAPDISKTGLCGLSGAAHGLMAYAGMEMAVTLTSRKAGLLTFLLVFGKSLYEAATGTVVFDFMHMGLCGSPLAICHLGGVVGGMVAFGLTRMTRHLNIELSKSS